MRSGQRTRESDDKGKRHIELANPGAGYEPMALPTKYAPNGAPREKLQDCIFLGIIVVLSLVLYVGGLGFYSDDWVFLQILDASQDQSLPGLVQSLYVGDVVIQQRPLQIIYLAGLYRLFGFEPLGYHLANALVLISIPILFYLLIREMGELRPVALSIPLVYILLPHYSTDRFWIAAFQANLSIALCFLSIFADLRAVCHPAGKVLEWKLVSFVCIIGSVLAYEVVLPLLLLSPFLSLYLVRSRYGSGWAKRLGRSDWITLIGFNAVALALVIGFKAIITVRLNIEFDYLSHLVYLVTGAVRVNYISYGLALPYVILWVLRHAPRWDILVASVTTGALVFAYLYRVTNLSQNRFPDQKYWQRLVIFGFIVFALGYAIFLINTDLDFRSTSLGNRVAIAAAVGVALSFVGGLGWIVSRIKANRIRAISFASLVALLCLNGFLINNTLAAFWIDAYREQQSVVQDLYEHVPTLPPDSTLILDGICLQRGGAYLFTGKRDIGSLVMMKYSDKSLWATAITNPVKIEMEHLDIFSFRDFDHYPYGPNLLAYHFPTKKLIPLSDANAAREYFAGSNFDPIRDCPPGFAWGWDQKW